MKVRPEKRKYKIKDPLPITRKKKNPKKFIRPAYFYLNWPLYLRLFKEDK